MRSFVLRLSVLAVIVLSLPSAYATCGGGGGGGTGGMMPSGGGMQPEAYVVPWKVLNPDTPAPATPLTLYWFPATKAEVKENPLLGSRALTMASAQCVSM